MMGRCKQFLNLSVKNQTSDLNKVIKKTTLEKRHIKIVHEIRSERGEKKTANQGTELPIHRALATSARPEKKGGAIKALSCAKVKQWLCETLRDGSSCSEKTEGAVFLTLIVTERKKEKRKKKGKVKKCGVF